MHSREEVECDDVEYTFRMHLLQIEVPAFSVEPPNIGHFGAGCLSPSQRCISAMGRFI